MYSEKVCVLTDCAALQVGTTSRALLRCAPRQVSNKAKLHPLILEEKRLMMIDRESVVLVFFSSAPNQSATYEEEH